VDGRDIRTFDVNALRRHIGVVAQDPALFAMSLEQNIWYGRPDASRAEVLAAAKAAHVLEFADRFPDGLHTLVGERGTRLSGGQRQRLALARVLLKDPPILLLDEATSALDAESEHHVCQAVERVTHGRTVVSIAHRLSTIRQAHRVAVLQGGRVVQQGPFAELVADSAGPFAQLVARQL
jgi:ABC-type multidrug transport system fused ATPase/permease subunit